MTKFPLGQGHKFGPKTGDISVHCGEGSFAESEHLADFQHHLMLHWDPNVRATGRWDGPTGKVIPEIQRVSGLMVTGYLNEETWYAAYSRPERGEVAPVAVPSDAPETPLRATETDFQPVVVVPPTPDTPKAPTAKPAKRR